MSNKVYELVKQRHLTPQHIMCATALGELANEGALNQGNALLAGRVAGRNLAEYVKGLAEEAGEEPPSTPAEAAEMVIKLINLSDDYRVEPEEKGFVVGIRTNMCKFCPKGVGGAEIPGTVCPFPGVIEAFVSDLLGKKVKVLLKQADGKGLRKTPLLKKEGYCTMEFLVEG